ncbi:MAG TPA: prephenate dehydrogenase/arogenate dehydrogenase family protein [Vicinamibacterales bacterium]|nr:prephenate dehydrogenase/arogenate dehydrogenase family protein [Vicinamibacterales bacterium]
MAGPVSSPGRGPDGPGAGVIAITGLGLIGGSIAYAIRRRWPGTRLIGVDRPDVLQDALARGAVTEAAGLDGLRHADLVILATPISEILRVLARLPDLMPGSAVVTDTGSTKQAIMAAAAGLPERLAFVGGHPVAGDSRGGLGAARADLFDGRPWVLVPGSARASAVERVATFIARLGARPARLEAADHDRLFAAVSHLPQLVASVLMATAGLRAGAEGLRLAGGGLRDTTRLAASPPGIWTDILATNADEVTAAIDDLIARLRAAREDLRAPAALARLFDEARRWRDALEDGGDGGA